LGLTQYYQASEDNELRDSVEKLGDFIFQHYQDEAKDDWHWFEHCLTYDNARLTQAMFEAYGTVGKQEYLDAAKESMDFLLKTQMIDGVFVPIGNDGWFKHGGKRAFYDQQPLEAAALVEAAIDAYCVTKEKDYLQVADKAFEWFLGKNSRNVVVYDHVTGGCCDGLGTNKVNMNQGAESSVSYLLARLKLEECRRGFWKQKKRLD
jgi:rhamnogalacturonyl hydrolase YesR